MTIIATLPKPSDDPLSMREIKPPARLPQLDTSFTVFLAGSIEQGRAVDWQRDLVTAFKDKDILFLNPRRDQWDPNWRQDIEEEQFREQVEWELDALEKADLIIMYLQPETLSPITLLELGLFARSNKLVVCCPDGYWRKGNVDVVCKRFGIQQVEKFEDLISVVELGVAASV